MTTHIQTGDFHKKLEKLGGKWRRKAVELGACEVHDTWQFPSPASYEKFVDWVEEQK